MEVFSVVYATGAEEVEIYSVLSLDAAVKSAFFSSAGFADAVEVNMLANPPGGALLAPNETRYFFFSSFFSSAPES